tara:strand:- start:32094 stop:32282 length:189 start_codon:yes stop_codon:yes gene_type:complete
LRSDKLNRLIFYRKASIGVLMIGVALVAFMIIVEDEPGGVPLILVLTGTLWFFFLRFKNPRY